MTDETRNISIVVKASQAITSLNQVGNGLSKMNSLVGSTDKQLASAETQLQKYGQKIGAAAVTLNELKQANKDLASSIQAANKMIAAQSKELATSNSRVNDANKTIGVLRGSTSALVGSGQKLSSVLSSNASAFDKNSASVSSFKNNLNSFQSVATKTRTSVSSLLTSINPAGLSSKGGVFSSQAEGLQRLQSSLALTTAGTVRWSDASNKALASVYDGSKNISDFTQQNIGLRYALYSVATTFGLLTAAGVKAYSDLFSAGINFQKDIAGVLRTSQVESASTFSNSPLVLSGIVTAEQQATLATQSLSNAFLDLQSSIPVTEEDLTTIGTLASQMGIAASNVANFTQVTAEFSAATGIDASTSATGLARIAQLLPDVAGNYSGLASAILKTGVNSIATEAQILQSSQNIASIGRIAGLSAVQVIALSSGMSSLGITSELQRSTVTQSFTKIVTAVDEGSDSAAKFGSVLGLSGKQFQDAWSKNPYDVFIKLTNAIAGSSKSVQILSDLGLASQRLTPTLLKIGQNSQVFASALKDTSTGMKQNTELTRQFQIIAQTTAARLQVLSQTWDKFLVVIGGPSVNAIGGIAKAITDLLNGLSKIATTPAGQIISNIVIVVGLLGVALLGVTTAVTLGAAALLGLGYVVTELGITTSVTTAETGLLSFAIDKQAASALIASGRTAILSGSMLGLRGALAALLSPAGLVAAAIVGIAVAVENASKINETVRNIQRLPNSLKGVTNSLLSSGDHPGNINEVAKEPAGGFLGADRGLGGLFGSNFGDIRQADEGLATLAAKSAPAAEKELEKLHDAWIAAKGSNEGFAAAFPDTISALDLASGKTKASAAQLKAYYATQSDAEDQEQRTTDSLEAQANALGLISDQYVTAQQAHDDYVSAVENAGSSSLDVTSLITEAYGTDKGQGGGLKALQKNLNTQLTAFQQWSAGVQKLTAEGAGSVAQAFIAAGPSSQQAVTDALKLSPTALSQLNTSMREAAFYASAAYAEAFDSQNSILADVYKKVLGSAGAVAAQNALGDAITDLGSGDTLSLAQVKALQDKYHITLNADLLPELDPTKLNNLIKDAQAAATAKPIKVPVVTAPSSLFSTATGGGPAPVPKSVQEYAVTEAGHSIVLKVAPDTKEGTKTLDAWRANEYKTPASMAVYVDTSAASKKLTALKKQIAGFSASLFVNVQGFGTVLKPHTGGQVGNNGLAHFAQGGGPGMFRGPGTGTSDSIPAMVSAGEYINTAAAVRYYGTSFFEAINHRQFPRFSSGGSVGANMDRGQAAPQLNVTVTQNYPTTKDPIKKLKEDAQNIVAGIWG